MASADEQCAPEGAILRLKRLPVALLIRRGTEFGSAGAPGQGVPINQRLD